jgi:hypothetical protein
MTWQIPRKPYPSLGEFERTEHYSIRVRNPPRSIRDSIEEWAFLGRDPWDDRGIWLGLLDITGFVLYVILLLL